MPRHDAAPACVREVCAIDARRFHPLDEADDMYAHLRTHGFVVVREVADAEAVQKGHVFLWDFLEAHSSRVLQDSHGRVDREDPGTWWCDRTWAPNAKDGIVYGLGIGQSEFMWHLRMLPRVRQAFAAVWERAAADDAPEPSAGGAACDTQQARAGYALRSTVHSSGAEDCAECVRHPANPARVSAKRKFDSAPIADEHAPENADSDSVIDDLLVSFDSAGVFRPWRERQKPTKGGWYHTDQNYWNTGQQGFACVQGLVTLTDVHEGTGGLALYPGSHHHFAQLSRLKRVKQEYEDCSEEYVRFHEKDLQQVLGKRRTAPCLVRAHAGDMILWDSRVVHSGTPSWYPGAGVSQESGQEHSKCAGLTAVGGSTFPDLAQDWRESPSALLRIAGYVCMMPASRIPAPRRDHVLDVRKRIFARGWSTTHWPLQPALGAKEAEPQLRLQAPANRTQRRLIGFR